MSTQSVATPELAGKSPLAKTYEDVLSGKLTLGQAVAALRKHSGLNQPEFAKHRGISVAALRQIEQDVGNPTVSTLNKVVAVFGVKVGFVRAPKTSQTAAPTTQEKRANTKPPDNNPAHARDQLASGK